MNRVIFFTFFLFWAFSGYCDEKAKEEIKKEPIQKEQIEKQKINSIYIFEKDQKIEDFSKEGIFVEADEKFSKEKLKNNLLPFLKKEINEQNISSISKTIKEFFKNSNYPFVLVSLPAQKIDNGVIKFVISESKLGSYEIIGNKYFTKKIFQKYLDLENHDPIDVQRINRHIQLINKNPFRNVNILFKPGKELNTTDIDVLVKDRMPYRIYGGIDNTGLVSTGFNRIFAGLNLGNLWALDHIFSYQFTSASNINEFQSHTISYTLPVFYKNFITVFSGYSKIRPDQQIQYLNNHGKSFQASFRYAFLLNPTRKLNHEVDVGFDYKYSNINLTYRSSPIIKNRVNITQVVAKYEALYSYGQVRWPFSLELFYSPGRIISKQKNSDFSMLRYRAKNEYIYGLMQFSPYFSLKNQMSIWFNLRSQLSSSNLISSEQFGLGGYDTVRGYSEREVNKDNAVLLNFEVRSASVKIFKCLINELQFLAFLDTGAGWDKHSTPNVKNFQYLAGIGPGLRYNIKNNLACRLDLGFKLHKTDVNKHADYRRLHFSFIGSF